MTAVHSPASAVKLIFSKSNIDIVANTPEVGEAKESLPVRYKGREFSIAFDPEFLMAPLRNLVFIHFGFAEVFAASNFAQPGQFWDELVVGWALQAFVRASF